MPDNDATLTDTVTAATKRLLARRTTTLRERAERAETERDGVYRERARLVALVAAGLAEHTVVAPPRTSTNPAGRSSTPPFTAASAPGTSPPGTPTSSSSSSTSPPTTRAPGGTATPRRRSTTTSTGSPAHSARARRVGTEGTEPQT